MFIGELRFELAQYSEAVDLMAEGMPDAPTEEQRYRYGLALERSGNLVAAAQQYEEITVPKDTPEELRVAWIHLRERNFLAAFRDLDDRPQAVAGQMLRAQAQLMLGRTQDVVDELPAESADATMVTLRALALELLDESAGAARAYQRVISSGAPDTDPILERAVRAAARSGLSEIAVAAGMRMVPSPDGLDWGEHEVHPAYRALIAQAAQARGAADFQAAAALYFRIAMSSSSPENSTRSFLLLGECLAQLGELDRATQAFAGAILYPMPNAAESLPNGQSRLSYTERYTELWEALPLEPDTILYESFHGASTSCNPLAICLELLKRDTAGRFQHVWVVNDASVIHPELLEHPNVHFVRRDSWGYQHHLASAGTLINNTTFPPRFIRRPGQRYANTWHGTPWKHLGRDIASDPFGHDNAGRNFLQATHVLLPNQHTADTLIRTHDIAGTLTREPWVIGSPRVDQTLQLPQQRAQELRSRLGLSDGRPAVLYAPTWRGALGAVELDATPFLDAVTELSRHAGDVLLRVHHLLSRAFETVTLPDNVRMVPDDIDTNELLAVTDVLVSDYSSIIFDFAPLNRPIVKYVFDLETYTAERGLYFDVEEVPGATCETPQELGAALQRAVRSTRADTDWSQSSTAQLWAVEDGNATNRAIDALFTQESAARDTHARALVSLSGLRANGVTRSLRNLVSSLADQTGLLQVMVPKAALETDEARGIAQEIHEHANITMFTGIPTGTRHEVTAWQRFQDPRLDTPAALLPIIRRRMERERRRYFPDSQFTTVIDFDGYGAGQVAFVGLGFPGATRRVYVAHSEFREEMSTRFPKLRQIGAILPAYTDVATVSESAMSRNREDLAELFGVPEGAHSSLPNTLDIAAIRQASLEPLEPDLREWFAQPGPHAVIVARLSVEKNHSAVIEALGALREHGETLRLLLVGGGPRRTALETLARDRGVADLVMFAGHRDNPYPAIAAADALLLSSTHEGQGLVLFEAILLGVPVAASNISGPASVLAGGRHGLLVPPTAAGMEQALRAVLDGELVPAQLDVERYQEEAVEAFRELLAPAAGGNPGDDDASEQRKEQP